MGSAKTGPTQARSKGPGTVTGLRQGETPVAPAASLDRAGPRGGALHKGVPLPPVGPVAKKRGAAAKAAFRGSPYPPAHTASAQFVIRSRYMRVVESAASRSPARVTLPSNVSGPA